MRTFFSTLTPKKIASILIWFLILFFLSTRGLFAYQKITNSNRFLIAAFSSYHQDMYSMEDTGTHIKIHTIWERTKTPIVVLGWAWGWVYGWRHLIKQPGFFDQYQILLINQTKKSQIPNPEFIDKIQEYVRNYLDQTNWQKPILLAKWWGTYTALQILHNYPNLFEQAVFINGYFNTLLDTTSNKERESFRKYGFLLSPNFKKAFLEKLTIENEMNLHLQDMRVEQSLKTPILVLHGKFDLGMTSSHALFLQEAFKDIGDEERVEVILTDTKQLSLRKHGSLIYQFLRDLLQ